jgi:hypothetical protein
VADLKDPRWIYAKGLLFLACGLLASSLLLGLFPSVRAAVLLVIAIWCFCRFYYFAFYVIQHYVDERYRFAGLLDFAKYAIRQRLGWKRATLGDESEQS